VNEDRARAEVYARSAGVDEIVGHGLATDWSHRIARGRMGEFAPWNGIHVSAGVHGWLHAHPELAQAGGWHLLSGSDPQEEPVWLSLPWPSWWRIQDLGDGGPHVLSTAWDDDRPRPVLPFERIPLAISVNQ
jgi:hypothetical protein